MERGTDVESWNDERLDELSRRMDSGFSEMRDGFARLDDRIFKLTIAIIIVGGGMFSTVLAALFGLIGPQS